MRKIGLFSHRFSKNVSVGIGDKEISCGTQLSESTSSFLSPNTGQEDCGLLVKGSQGSRSGSFDLGTNENQITLWWGSSCALSDVKQHPWPCRRL